MTSEIRAVFFDAGNTLLHPKLEVVIEGLSSLGYSAKLEDFDDSERIGKRALEEWLWPLIRKGEIPKMVDPFYWRAYLEHLVARLGVPEEKRPEMMISIANHYREIELWARVTPETAPTLSALKAKGYSLGVISNSIGTIEDQLRRSGLRDYFSTVLDSALVGVEKPHPRIFELALERAHCKASESVFIGDNYAIDVGGAELAGWRGILLDRVGAYPEADCPRINSLAEVPQVI